MKLSALFLALSLIPLSAYSAPAQPVCEATGSKGEGWYLDGELLAWSRCEHKTIACLHVGTRSEGWYEIDEDNNVTLVKWAMCGLPQSEE